CGDGTLLLRLYEAIRDRTPRGKVLDAHPVIPVGVDFNDKALVETSRTLAGIEHLAVHGDIGDPAAMLVTLREHGVELHRAMHVRSFLDHDRPYRAPQDLETAARRTATGVNVYIDGQGNAIPPGVMIQSTVEHLRRWSDAVNEHGLVVLEVHCLPPHVTARYRDESENFHFDVYHALSHQFLLDASTYLACAAEAGLFCSEGRAIGFPRNLPYTRITLSHFERRPYIVRHENDQFSLEVDGRTLAAVRCEQGETIRVSLVSAQTESALDDLLRFVQQYWSLADVGRVEGLDACRASVAATTEEETTLARAVARDVRTSVARYPFAAKDDPRAAERELGQFSFRWLLANLQRMGVMQNAGERYHLDALKERLGITPRYHRYFDAMMRRLQDEGLVVLNGRSMETTALLPGYALTAIDEQVAEFKQSFAQRYPATVGLMNLAAATLSRYEEVITGRADITHVLFENADMDGFAKLFRGDVVSDYFNRIVADAVCETVTRLKDAKPKVRILEIGAGTGGTTVGVVEALRPFANSVEFCFTDISLSFVRNAKRLFGQYPWVDYRALNIEEDLGRQGFEEHAYDVIIAANVLHDTRDIVRTLELTRRLLAPGGLLLLNEYTFVKESLSFSGALLHGWWLFEDPQRRLRDSCLMSVPQWKTALEDSGFALIEAFALPTQSTSGECTQSVMLCESVAMHVGDGSSRPGRAEAHPYIATVVEEQFLRLLGEGRASAYSPQRPTMDMGLDSIEIVELKSALESSFGVKLTPMFLFEHETPEKLAAALAEIANVGAGSSRPGRAEAHPYIATIVEEQFLRLLGEGRASAYSPQRPTMDMGLDSIEIVELKSALESSLGVKLTPMFLFEHETPEKLAAALAEIANVGAGFSRPGRAEARPYIHDDARAEARPRVPAPDPQPEHDPNAVAIVGVACRFPGGASSPDAFWKLLESGKSAIVPMPADRWRWPSFVDLGGKHRGIDKAGFLERVDEFDASFFRISAKEAELMDPQQRLLLELSWEAMEDGGHRPSELSGQKIGVFVGVCHSDYRELLTTAIETPESYIGTGSAHSLLSNRLSFFYDFKGPSLTVDTACSSSLVALHDAVAAIRRGDCEQALVGAVNLLCSPTNSVTYYQAGMLSPTGTCRTFDANADGFVRGEGGAMLLVKPLRTALSDGDAIYGLVTGTAVNHGGQAASLTAPKPESQATVVETAWKAANAPLASIGYIEAHGTGTRLGDPVEIAGLKEAFRRLSTARGESSPTDGQCGLGSVKTVVGHLEGAAGLAGVVKILLALRHRTIPATLHFGRINPDIDLAGSPFHVVSKTEAWPTRGTHPRRAGVSSFGFGGANSHVVIEEYTPSANATPSRNEYLIPLSAKSDRQLIALAKRLLAFLETATPSLADVAYTLQVGREAMEKRVAFVVEDMDDLLETLSAFVAGQPLSTAAAIDPTKLLSAGRRTHLPTYPFERQRYWVPEPARVAAGAETRLHPLVHRNTSDLREQRFSSTFSGEEFFLAGHRIGGRRLLPGVAYIEMAREAVARAAGEGSVSIRNLVWMRPIAVGETPLDVHVGLVPKDKGEIGFEIYSGSSDDEVVHARGIAAIGAAVEAPRIDVAALARKYRPDYSADACYAAFRGRKVEYGAEHRAVEGLRVEGDEIVARLFLSASSALDQFTLHPGLLDSALQAILGFDLAADDDGTGPSLPFELRSAEIYGACTAAMWAVIRRVAAGRFDVDLCDDEGRVRVRLSGLTMRPLEARKPAEAMAETPELSGAPDDDVRQRLEAALTRIVTRLVKVRAEDVKPTSELGDLGFDSISYIEFVDEILDDYGVEVQPTVFFEHRTLERFSRYLLQTHAEAMAKHFGRASAAPTVPAPSKPAEPVAEKRQRPQARFTAAPAPAAAPTTERTAEPIAIVGMSGRFPMDSDVNELWENLANGRDCIGEVPADRWDWRAVYGNPADDNKTNIKWGGFMDGVYDFDPQFFNISPREATLMDPQQRLLMMYVWKAIEDAGYSPSQLSGSDTAIFFATGINDYGRIVSRSATSIDAYVATGNVSSVGPNRMSYFLDLHGPSDPVETACSSSLVAIHRAVAAMRSGECEMAIVGGVNTILTPDLHISFTKAGMLSEDGRCKTFSANANGYVRSEGVAALLLKPLSAAEAAGDHIYGVILGSAENHGGRANTLTSPNPQAQAALLKRAYKEAGVDPSTVSYIETHGTGTALGDPIEVEGLKSAFAQITGGHCGIGSVKSNIGHLELAAGIAGVIKVLLQMKHRTLAPTLHCESINPYIQLGGSPFYVVQEKAEWSSETPRRAGVSSFGFGGSNAHIVLQEYVGNHVATATTSRQAILLSARTPERLREQAEQLLAANIADADLADVAYTLQVGREAMEERVAFVASSVAELKAKLQSFLNGEAQSHRGKAQKGDASLATLAGDDTFQTAVTKWIEQGRVEMLLDLWIKGLDFDWTRLHAGADRRRVSLPTYPFAREHYGIELTLPGQAATRTATSAAMHPLLHANSSTLDEQSYRATFRGDEFFFTDHKVRVDGSAEHKVLPG
ncbi:MAG: polyketide synthase dehydratase domain-containing protein, partial [Acidobacteria bacterium]|nr:polyketide synthase dehydratase domain-containing protein [Acidobacteriota bacterium]